MRSAQRRLIDGSREARSIAAGIQPATVHLMGHSYVAEARTPLSAAALSNLLRVFWNFDRHDLVEAGVIAASDENGWLRFAGQPHREAVRLPDDRFDRLFELVCRRMPSLIDQTADDAALIDLIVAETIRAMGRDPDDMTGHDETLLVAVLRRIDASVNGEKAHG